MKGLTDSSAARYIPGKSICAEYDHPALAYCPAGSPLRRALIPHIRAAKGDHRMPAIVSGIGRKSNTNVVNMRPTATALRISSISDCLGIESDLTLYGLVHDLLGIVCAGEVIVDVVVAQEGFEAELAAIDYAARLRYGGLYHTQSVGYWPLTTSPDPSGVAVSVGVEVGVDVEAAPLSGSRAARVVMAMRASARSPDAPYARRR